MTRDNVMRSGRSVLPLVALAMMATGCAGLDGASKLQATMRIGIVSAIGDDFTLTRAGLTGIDGSSRHAAIETWGVDDLVTGRISDALAPKFQIQPVAYPRTAFAAQKPVSPFKPAELLERDGDRVAELVRIQVAPQGLDAYVVVTKASASYGGRGGQVAGIGIVDHVAVFGSSAQLHALYTITVVDGHSLKVIGKRTAMPTGQVELFKLAGPSRDIGTDLVSAAENPAGSVRLKAAIVDLIDQSLGSTLQELHLLDKSGS